jgi:hypothetical protein
MRTSSLLACLALAACGGKPGNADGAGVEKLMCAVDGQGEFAAICTAEQNRGAGGKGFLTVSKPDGSFRRLLVTDDGRSVIAADGAEAAAVVSLGDGLIEVTIGGDRYRLPATIRPDLGKAQ